MDELSFFDFGVKKIYLRDDIARVQINDLNDKIINGDNLVTNHNRRTVSFYDPIGNEFLDTLILNITVSQGGSGTPSPTNYCPFIGYTACNIYHSEMDMSSPTTLTINFPSNANTIYQGSIDILSGKITVTHVVKTINSYSDIAEFNSSRQLIYIALPGMGSNGINTPDEITNNLKCDRFYTLSTSASWNNYDLFISKVSGNENAVLKYADVFTSQENINTWLTNNPIQIFYKLTTPIEYEIPTHEIATYQGTNIFWCDTGIINTITYKNSISNNTSNDIRDNVLHILAFGNSFTFSTLEYLPQILEELLPTTQIIFGICYNNGCPFAQHIVKFNNQDTYALYAEYNTAAQGWTTIDDTFTAQMTLDKYPWDIIILQQSVENLSDFDNLSNFCKLIASYINYPTTFVYNMAQARHPGDTTWLLDNVQGNTGLERSNNHFNMIAEYGEDALNSTFISAILPCATALQNLRTYSSMTSIGDAGYLAKDGGGHLQQGLGPLCCGYVAAYEILKLIGIQPKIFGIQVYPTDEWLIKYDSPFKDATGSCVGVTKENIILAQQSAAIAIKKPFELTNMENN